MLEITKYNLNYNINSFFSWIYELTMLFSAVLIGTITIIFNQGALAQTKQPDRVIEADISRIKGPLNKSFNTCVGAGRANEGLRADWQSQLR